MYFSLPASPLPSPWSPCLFFRIPGLEENASPQLHSLACEKYLQQAGMCLICPCMFFQNFQKFPVLDYTSHNCPGQHSPFPFIRSCFYTSVPLSDQERIISDNLVCIFTVWSTFFLYTLYFYYGNHAHLSKPEARCLLKVKASLWKLHCSHLFVVNVLSINFQHMKVNLSYK